MTNDFDAIVKGDLLTFSQAADMLGVTAAALRMRVRARRINAVKVGGIWFVRSEDVEKEARKRAKKKEEA